MATLPESRRPSRYDAPPAPVRRDSTSELGAHDDAVRVQLGNDEIRTAESYEVERGIFTQPSAFALTLGDDESSSNLWKRYPPRTPFKLFVGNTLVQSGFTDSRMIGGTAAGFMIRGRDHLQEIHDSYTRVEKNYKDPRHIDLIYAVFKDARLPRPVVVLSNEANRKAMALGKKLPAPAKAKEEVEIPRPVPIKMGDTYYGFLKRVLDRAGLFLFAAADGTYVLSAPDKDLPPLYRLVHAPVGSSKMGNVTSLSLSDSTVGRCSFYEVYSRGGGKKMGALKFKDGFPDDEMEKFGYQRSKTFRDWHVQSDAQAEIMARRKIAEERRASYRLTVSVVGHTTLTPEGARAIWTPDTVVEFDSDELEIRRNFYIESVAFRRGADGTTTELRLIRTEDLLFGTEDA